MRKFALILTIKLIRKYFPEGISVITDKEENIIAYRWTWTKEIDDIFYKKQTAKRREL